MNAKQELLRKPNRESAAGSRTRGKALAKLWYPKVLIENKKEKRRTNDFKNWH